MRRSPKQREALRLVAEGRFYPDFVKEDDGWHARWRAVSVDNDWVDAYVREAAMTRLTEDAELERHETLHDAWMMALKSRTGLVVWDEAECAQFAAELREWSGSADEDVEARAAIVFGFRAGAADSFQVVCAVPKSKRGLRALGQSMYVFPPLRGLRTEGEIVESSNRRMVESGEAWLGVSLSRAEAESFVRSGARELREAGYGVTGADLAAEITAVADIGAEEAAEPHDGNFASCRLTVKVAGEPVTANEIRFLLEQGSSLVFFRDRWIEVDRNILKQALRALEKNGRKVASPIGFALGIGRIGDLEIAEVKAHGWLRGFVNELRMAGKAGMTGTASEPPPGFEGVLRPYQARGVTWLRFLTDHGFGALLADDMGLGKTVQAIACLAAGAGAGPALVVAPLTLLPNWRHEFAHFAPQMGVYVHQGDRRGLGMAFRRELATADVVITSYNLLVKDYSLFSQTTWSALVLDEAQAIKNPDTQAARAVCALRPCRRIALTGTPIENSVADIWSIEEFLNPGFLGDRKSFEERFAKPLALDEQSVAGKRLRHALEPFVLRRLKTDGEIAAELGEKREIKEFCVLSADQRRAYEMALEDFRAGERRSGDVFALLTELKFICDGRGKLDRLVSLLEQIFETGESALVFTQYVKVGETIRREIESHFGQVVPFLHGSLTVKEREAQIAAFNRRGARAFVLSLKAGGFGLNLTKATHVIHFDRWWNPAVENQATDRAHRIGQAKTVFVHPFITVGTLEEHVDELLERKSRIAGTLVQSGESWLAEMSAKEFEKVVELG